MRQLRGNKSLPDIRSVLLLPAFPHFSFLADCGNDYFHPVVSVAVTLMYCGYDARCYFNVCSKADMSSLCYGTEPTTKKWKTENYGSQCSRTLHTLLDTSTDLTGFCCECYHRGHIIHYAPTIGSIKRCRDPSVCLSPELCGLRIHPHTDVDPPRLAGVISSRCAISCWYRCAGGFY